MVGSVVSVVKIPLEEVKGEWLGESFPTQCKVMAKHYGIYRDLFDGAHFTPVINLDVLFEYDAEYVTPVYRGNKIPPVEVHLFPPQLFNPLEPYACYVMVVKD